ncbi:MAG: LapA family protein [Syntrophales bacterium]|jgi:uncharacterized integral membrane protein
MIFILFLSALSLIFIVQNIDVVEVRFLFWSISMSREILILFALLIGFTLGWFLHSYFSYKK